MEYFATLDTEDVLPELNRRISRYDEWLSSSGLMTRWARVLKVYNGLKPDDTDMNLNTVRLRSHGKQGELAYLHANHFRNLCQHVLVLVTGQRPALQVRASNSDFKSQVQAQLGNSVLDYYLREKRIEANLKQAVEHCILWGESHVSVLWNPGAGEPYVTDPDTQRVVREGDIEVRNILPNDLIRDSNARRLEDCPWRIVRRVENKHELMAKFPDKASAIGASVTESVSSRIGQWNDHDADSDLISSYWFFHEKTDLVPEGRMIYFVNGGVLVDGSLPYDGIPIYSMIPSEIPNLPTGYTPSFDALPLQESINIIGSSIISNQRAFGVQNIWTKPGGVSVTEIAGSLNLIETNEKPEALQLCATPPELFNFRQTLIQEMENIMGINSVVRGNPEANLKSGAALALVASQAVQFMSGLQGSYNSAMEGVGGSILRLLQTYAKTTRVATIVGVKGRAYQKQFSGADLAAARSVVVEQVAAVSKTAAGQIEIANQLLQANMIKRPEEYLSVVTTGKLDPLVEDDSAKLLLVRAENEAMLDGRPHMAHVGEIHADHIQGHLNLLASPEAKEDGALVTRVLAAVSEHLTLWRTADPAILMITGQQPPPPPPGVPGGPDQGQGPEQGQQGEVSPEVMNQAQPSQPNMPSLPEGAPPESQAAYAQLAPQPTPGMISG
jgi:hypothetical protein